jgi:general secretion pathway protein G
MNNKNNKSKRSFTLIELLVVIAVLAGMIALLVPNFMAIREKSRDVRRKSDLKSIQKALELYNQNQNPRVYPSALPTPCQPFTDANGIVYMQKFPLDPLYSCTGVTSNYYLAQPTPGEYLLGACMENKNDPEVVSCPAGFNTVTNTTCSTAKCYMLTQP